MAASTGNDGNRMAPLLFGAVVAVAIALGGFAMVRDAGAEATEIVVYKTPTCGCCGDWIDHLEAAGFEVKARDLPDLTELKANNGVPRALASCHTAMVEGYVIEGHVPAADINRLLESRPKVAGLAVPGMPLGSPGMEHPDPRRHEAYDVVAFGTADAKGTRIFASHAP